MDSDGRGENVLLASVADADELLGGTLGDGEKVLSGGGAGSRQEILVEAVDAPRPVQVIVQGRLDPGR
jgi:hypothetical protein